MEHIHNGRTWTLRGREPYTRKDGSRTELLVWETACAVCGGPFQVKTPAALWRLSQGFAQVHCEAHKLTRKQATARWLQSFRVKGQKNAR